MQMHRVSVEREGIECVQVGWQWERGDGGGAAKVWLASEETAKRRQRSGPLERSTNTKGHKRRIRKDRWIPRPVNRVNT